MGRITWNSQQGRYKKVSNIKTLGLHFYLIERGLLAIPQSQGTHDFASEDHKSHFREP